MKGYTVIDLNGRLVDVDYEYHHAERCVPYDSNGTGYPGDPEYVEITGVLLTVGNRSRDIAYLLRHKLDNIADRVLNQIS